MNSTIVENDNKGMGRERDKAVQIKKSINFETISLH